jgi:hypothetical protein
MKQSILFLMAYCCALSGQCQQVAPPPPTNNTGELAQHCPVYLYPDSTMGQLRQISDALNLRFKTCDLNRQYLSVPQAKAHYLSLEKGNIAQAKKDLEMGMGLDAFRQKYRQAKLQKDLLVLLSDDHSDETKPAVSFETMGLGRGYEHSLSMPKAAYQKKGGLAGQWVLEYKPKSQYSSASLEALFFTTGFASRPLPEKYGRMALYVDCMVDTSTNIYLSEEMGSPFEERAANAIDSLMVLVRSGTDEPVYSDTGYSEDKYKQYRKAHEDWEAHVKFKKTDSLFIHDKAFVALWHRALAWGLKKGGSTDKFEEYVERYASPATALLLKRNRRVMGMCSMDMRPIEHATQIARLSAAAVNWEVFLRAHLDIMNDRFDRAVDGNYAWEGRQTYLPELEALNINVLDLMLGITLRYEDANPNHYWGSIWRVGKALVETSQPEAAKKALLAAVADTALDDYNRTLFYYVYTHYIYRKYKDNEEKAKALDAEAMKRLPAYMAATGK